MSGRPVRAARSPGRPRYIEIDEPGVKGVNRTKSPGRPKSPARGKSPGRPKSPARVKAERPKSPGRTKSPGRGKSPPRVTRRKSPSPPPARKALTSRLGTKKASPVRLSSEVYVTLKKEAFDAQPFVDLKQSIIEKKIASENFDLTGRGRTSSEDSSVISSTIIRRSARVSAIKESEKKLKEETKFDDLPSSINSLGSRVKALDQQIQTPREFGGWLGALILIIVMPLTVLATQFYCYKDKCPGTSFRISTNWRAYFDLEAAGWYLGFILSQVVLSFLPIGKLVDAQPGRTGRYQYRCNGLLNLLITLSAFGGLYYYNYPLVRVFDKQLQIAVAAIVVGVLLSIVLYIRGGRAPVASLNPNGISGNFLYDFWMGREINPRFGRLDVKWVLFRSAIIGTILLNELFVLKALVSQTKKSETGNVVQVDWAEKDYPPALLLAAGLQIFYMLNVLWSEDSFPSTFEAMSEGCGYMLTVGYAVYPFLPTLITKFLVSHRVNFPWYALGLIVVVHTIGYVIFKLSNSQKSRFRKNPTDPAVSHLETISTTRGTKLLVSGWWGWVRHPNYLGDLIMHWAWASTCGLSHWLPYTVPLSVTVLLLHRAVRDSARCRHRYGISWERYSARVKSLVIPKVF